MVGILKRFNVLWVTILLSIIFFLVFDNTFRLIGRIFFYSPWGATGNIVLSEKLFWIDGVKPDIVILGDSRAGNGIKPIVIERTLEEKGIKTSVVNIWLPGTGLTDLLEITERLVTKYPPRLTIVTINEKQLAQPPQVKEMKNWDQRFIHRWPEIKSFLDDTWWYLNLASGAMLWGAFIKRATYNAFFGIAKFILFKQKPPSGSIGGDKGYMRMEGKQKESRLMSQRVSEREWYKGYLPSKEGTKKLSSLIYAIKRHNINLLLITMPVSKEMFEIFPEEAYNGFIKEVEALSRDTGVKFLNFYPMKDMPQDYFFDLQHMNDRGAEYFSRYLVEEAIMPMIRN
ncbi:MAG: hypothetical protein N2745_07710 [Syntrophorhabdaceae bacterium]|nr:hypothetical protein [Syntrophorhabdaceae bacterium]